MDVMPFKKIILSIAKRLSLITLALAALSAGGAMRDVGTDSAIVNIALYIGIYIGFVPVTALVVIIFATPWYLIKWFRGGFREA